MSAPMTQDTPESVARIVAEMRERATDDRQHGEPDQQLEAWADELESLTPTPQAAPGGEAVAEVRDVLGFPHMVWIGRDYPVGTKLYTHPARSEAAPVQLVEAARKMLDFADSDYVPNTAFDRLRAALNAAPLPAQVDERMVERAIVAGMATRPREYPPNWPDDYDADEQAHGRAFMRAALTAALAQGEQSNGQV